MHRKHGIDRGTQVTQGNAGSVEGIQVESGVPLPEKAWSVFPETAHFGAFGFVQEFIWKSYNTIVLTLIFGIWFGVFPIGTARRPIHSTAVGHLTSRL